MLLLKQVCSPLSEDLLAACISLKGLQGVCYIQTNPRVTQQNLELLWKQDAGGTWLHD